MTGAGLYGRRHHHGRRAAIAAAVTLALMAVSLVLTATPAWAAPPANDSFAGAELVAGSLPLTASGTTIDATKEPGEPDHAGNPGGASVWYRWTPASDATVLIDTCDSGFDTLLAVYTGDTVGSLTHLVSNDDACGALASQVSLAATAGVTYRIAVDGYSGAAGAVILRIADGAGPSPVAASDEFGGAPSLDGPLPIAVTGTNDGASKEPGEPDHAGNPGGASVWYRWTPASNVTVSIETCGTDFNAFLGVYTGEAVDNLTSVGPAVDDGACDVRGRRKVAFAATAGETYSIAIDGYFGATGTIVLRIRATTPPPNDHLAAAEALTGPLPITATGTNRDATREPGEPDHAADPGAGSIWYSWTATLSAAIVVETCGSDFDTLLGVYQGTDIQSLTRVADNDNTGGCGPSWTGSRVAFTAEEGVTYLVAVDGAGAQLGSVGLLLRTTSPPANDSFASPVVIAGALPASLTGTTVDASAETGEPAHGDDGSGTSVWYRWTPAQSGAVVIDVCGTDDTTPTTVAAYTGDALETLTPVGLMSPFDRVCANGARLRLTATSGTTYALAVDGRLGGSGGFELTMQAGPPNDDFANGEVLTGLPAESTVSSHLAGAEPDEPAHAGRPAISSVWYRWIAPTSGPVVVETCDSDFATRLAVYTGDELAALAPVDSNNAGCETGAVAGPRSVVVFHATAGTTYHVAVDLGRLGPETTWPGTVVLRLRHAQLPDNDAFAGARVLDGPLPVSLTTTNFDATREADEPSHAGQPGAGSLWYRWTSSVSEPVVIDLCDSRFDTLLAVYNRSGVGDLEPVAADDDACGRDPFRPWLGSPSRVRFDAVAGQTYWIAIDGWAGARGTIVMSLRLPPANDAFASAARLGAALPVGAAGSNLDATLQEPERSLGHGTASVWYRWTPSSSGPTVIELCSNFESSLAVYRGDAIDTLSPIGLDTSASPWGCGGAPGNRIVLDAEGGEIYRIAVRSTWPDRSGSFRLRLRAPSPPPNDAFRDAGTLPADLPVTVEGTNVDATREAGEPDHGGSGGASVWYTWTAPQSGPVAVDTCGTDFASVLGVYTGGAVDALTEAATNDGTHAGCGAVFTPRARFVATAGTTYRIAIDGAAWSEGSPRMGAVTLNISTDPGGAPPPPPAAPPANDDFNEARVLSGALPIETVSMTAGATAEPGEPDHDETYGQPAEASVWYRWTPPSSGLVTVETCGSDFDTLLALYTGDDVGSLTRVLVGPMAATNDDSCGSQSRVVFDARAGETYRIAVDGRWGATGTARLRVRDADAPANDAFANAQTLAGSMPLTVAGTNVDATTEMWASSIEFDHAFDRGGASVWYRWIAPVSGPVEFNVCDADFQAKVAVYAGRSPATLADMARGTEDYSASVRRTGGCPDGGYGNVLVIPAVAGQEYRIAVDGLGGRAGSFSLRVSLPPANDDINRAQPIDGGDKPVSVFGSNVDATAEPGEPDHANRAGGASVWYRWTPSSSGRYIVETCGSEIDTLLSVSTGVAVNRLTPVAANDDACDSQSRVRLHATAGQTYWIAIDGADRATGLLKLQVRPDPRAR